MPLSLSAIDAAYSAAQELGFWSHQALVAVREPDLPAELPDGRRVPHGSRFLAQLARDVILEGNRDTHAKRILVVSDAILAANLSPGEYWIGEIVETTAHKAVLSYAQSLVNTAWNYQASRMRAGAEGLQDNDADWPTTWTAAVWPTIRSVLAAQPILNWNAVRVAVEREHAAAAAIARDQGGAGQVEASGSGEWVWAPDGDGYQVAGLGERGHFSGLRGLAMVEKLVRDPGRPVPMTLLTGAGGQQSNDKRAKQPTMDTEALRNAYNQCAVLRAELQQAEAEGRATEAQEARCELEQVLRQLQLALGIRGRIRDLNDLANKLRPSIHARLAHVYKAMRGANPPMPELATHLESAISSEGAAFVYRPLFTVTWNTTLSGQV
jgi:hypothetical protein